MHGVREKRALVAGASGLVGGECVTSLLESPHYREVVTLVRKPLPRDHPRLHQLQIDFDDIGAGLGSRVVDDVFCCLGTTRRTAGSPQAFRRVDYELPLELARVTRERGATQFVLVSSLGANRHARTFYLRVKGELEEGLDAMEFASLIIVRPSVLLGKRSESRPAEALAKMVLRLAAPFLVGAWRRFRPVPATIVARAMVTAANAGVAGRLVLESDELARLTVS